MHGSLSPFDMHNTCIAAGPDFRKGAQDDLPTGNIDIAPTILWILGVEPEHKLSGRVLARGFDSTRRHPARLRDSAPGSKLPLRKIRPGTST